MKFTRISFACAIIASSMFLSMCDDTLGLHDEEELRKICQDGENADICKYLSMFKDAPQTIVIENPDNTKKTEEITDINSIKLFDSDINTIFSSETTVWIKLEFGKFIYPRRMRIYGQTSYKINYYYINGSKKILVPSLSLTDQNLNDSWNSLWSDEVIKTNSLLLEIIPGENIEDGIREIEIWNGRIPDLPKDEIINTLEKVDSIDDLDVETHDAMQFVKIYKSTTNIINFYNSSNKNVNGTAKINIPIDPLLFKRA